MRTSKPKPSAILDKIVDLVLKHRPKDSTVAKKREKLEQSLASDVMKARKRATKRIEKARQEIEDGALPKKGRFHL
jgi:hypothetical protein